MEMKKKAPKTMKLQTMPSMTMKNKVMIKMIKRAKMKINKLERKNNQLKPKLKSSKLNISICINFNKYLRRRERKRTTKDN